MTGALVDLAPGMADPVFGSQAAFRTLLDAMARPGRVLELPPEAVDGIGTPPDKAGRPIGRGLAALLLTLLDAETTAAWHGELGSGAARAWLRFHTGAHEAAGGVSPDFGIGHARDLQPVHWHALHQGSEEAPQHGGTLILEVSGLLSAPSADDRPGRILSLTGPGIADLHRLGVDGVPDAFWQERLDMPARFPIGFELILVCGTRIAALPRSTHVHLER